MSGLTSGYDLYSLSFRWLVCICGFAGIIDYLNNYTSEQIRIADGEVERQVCTWKASGEQRAVYTSYRITWSEGISIARYHNTSWAHAVLELLS